ncbi:MAG: EamA family transporter [Vicinamibacterales bacterium]
MSTTRASARAYAAWVTVCVLWGTTYLAIRIALETIPPMLVGALRWTVAGVVLLAGFRLAGEPLPALRHWPMLTLLGVLLIGFGNGGVVWAEQTLPSGLTALLVATVPFWMIGVEWVSGTRDRLTIRRTIGLVVGFLGILLLVWPELQLGDGPAVPVAVLATQLACLGWAIGSTLARRRASAENVLVTAAVQMLCGGLVMLALGLLSGEWTHLAFTPRSSGALAYLAVFGSIAGFSAYAYALKHLPVATVSLYAYVNPVIAVVLGTLLAGEPWSPRLAVAGAAVLIGMALVKQ